MEKLDKTKIITIGIAALLVLVLVIVMLCAACSNREESEWIPLTTAGAKDTTGNTTEETKQGQQGTVSDTIPDINIDVVDKNKLEEILNQPTSPTTKPTTGGNTSSTQSTTQSTTSPTQGTTEATSSTQNTTQATENTEEPETTEATTGTRLLTWEEYNALKREEKLAYRDSFATLQEFTEWKTEAQAQYDSTKPVTDGTIDLGGN